MEFFVCCRNNGAFVGIDGMTTGNLYYSTWYGTKKKGLTINWLPDDDEITNWETCLLLAC